MARNTRALARIQATDYRWEHAEESEAHEVFTRWADMVRGRASSEDRRKRNLLYASLYGSLPLLGFGINTYTRSIPFQGAISLNVTQNAIDSLVAKVCKNRPRPKFMTTEADYELREKIETVDKYMDALFFRQKYYHVTFPGKVLDAAIYGLGCTKVYEQDGGCVIDRVYPWELIQDDRECMYGSPTRIGQRKYYDKQLCFDIYRRDDDSEWNDDLYECIEAAGSDPGWDDPDRDESSDQIMVFEGWRQPTPKSPGKIIQCIRGKTLRFVDDDSPESRFNFLRPETPGMGFWGVGVCEKVAGIQREINRIIQDIQRAMHLIAKPHWMVEASSNVLATSLNNDMATIIKYQGATPPQVYVPQAMSPEVYQHLQFLVKQLYETSGISQLSASSSKPAGLNTGVAIRSFLNIESERFNNFVRASEESAAEDAMKGARIVGGLSRKPMERWYPAKNGARGEAVKWEKVDIDALSVQTCPSSKLPDTDAGKREYALELAQYGVAKPDEVFEMLEWDDTEAFAKRRLAGRRNVETDIVKIRKGEKVIRDAIGDHATALQIMSDAYEEAKHDGLPQKRLAVMREYVRVCRKFLGLPPLPGQLPPQPGDPAAQPGPAPMPGAQDPNAPMGPNGPMQPGVPLLPVPPGTPPPNMAPPGAPPESPLPPGPAPQM